jgi:hypothetical protein
MGLSLVLLALASTCLLGNASRDVPRSSTPLQESAFRIAALHADTGVKVQPSQLPAQPAAAAGSFDVQWPSPRAGDQAELLSDRIGHSKAFKISKSTPAQAERARDPYTSYSPEGGAPGNYAEHSHLPAGTGYLGYYDRKPALSEDRYRPAEHVDSYEPAGGSRGYDEGQQQEEACLLANTFATQVKLIDDFFYLKKGT